MSDHGKDDIDDDDLNATNSGIADESKTLLQGGAEHTEIPFCGCLSVRFYQPYFDVDTAEIMSRISHAMFYCKRSENFFAFTQEKPDAYGPVWISTSLVFTVLLTSHINSWLLHWMTGRSWCVGKDDLQIIHLANSIITAYYHLNATYLCRVYDFQSIVKAPSLIYGFAGGAPVGIWFALRQFGAPTKLISIISLYGYSLFVYIPATVRLHSFPAFITSLISSATLTTYYDLFM